MTRAAIPAPAEVRGPRRGGPLFAGIAFAEWTKLRTLRSSYWTLLAAAAAMAGFGALLCAAYARHLTPASRAALDPAAYSESGFFLAQLAIGVPGVLTMTGEYATGSIRSTLAAAPQRVTVLAAKAAVFTAIAFLTGLAASLTAFSSARRSSPEKAFTCTSAPPERCSRPSAPPCTWRYSGLLALGLGALIRRTAGALAILIAVLIFLPAAVGALPATWRSDVNPYLPSVAGQAIIGHTKFTPLATCCPHGPGSPCSAATPPRYLSPPPSLSASGTPDHAGVPLRRLPAGLPHALTATVRSPQMIGNHPGRSITLLSLYGDDICCA